MKSDMPIYWISSEIGGDIQWSLESRNKTLATTLLSVRNGPPKPASKVKAGAWCKVKASADKAEIQIYEQIGRDWWTGDGIEAKWFANELKKIPKGTPIDVRINCNGGSVHDGMTIHNLLADRRDDVVCIVDGVAASIASVIALAGKELRMPSNTLLMIHDPWGYAQGNAADMRRAADMLEKHRDAICNVYCAKLKDKDPEELKKLMAAETWYTGAEAKEFGFADTVTDEISFSASAELAKYKRIPAALKALITAGHDGEQSASSSSSVADADEMSSHSSNMEEEMEEKCGGENSVASGGQPKTGDKMREKIIAKLKKLGVTVDANLTEDALLAKFDEIVAQQTNGNDVQGASIEDADEQAEAPKRGVKPPKAKKRNAPPATENADDQDGADESQATSDAVNRLARIEAKLEKERKDRISAAVQQAVIEDRIPEVQAQRWIDRAFKDESVLDDLRAMPPKPPGAEPVGIVITGESPKDVEKGLIAMRQPMDSLMRGNEVDGKTITKNAIATAIAIKAHRKKLEGPLAANTIATELKRTVILNDLMQDYKRRLLSLRAFSTFFENVPLQGTNKVSIPYYELYTTASKDYVAATGYEFDQDTEVGVREVNINKRKYQNMNFSSDTFRRQPYFRPDIHRQQKAGQLAVDVWTTVLGIITASNYGSSAYDAEAGTFDSDDLAALRGIAETNDWPTLGRTCCLSTDHEVALLQDDTIKSALHSGTTEGLREGSTGRLFGFDMQFSPRIPTNSEDLSGFICLPQAVLVATAPIMPAPGVRRNLLAYEVVVDPDTGIAFEYRYGASEWEDKDREVIECNFGFAKGNESALKRITSGSAVYSSSSSQSSVNSSSSSSSSASF